MYPPMLPKGIAHVTFVFGLTSPTLFCRSRRNTTFLPATPSGAPLGVGRPLKAVPKHALSFNGG